jgi:GAF domain-containing protein
MTDKEFRPARVPANEERRLSAVKRTGLMGSKALSRFDIYTRLFRHIAGVPVSYTGLLDEARQYFLSENFTGCLTGATEVARQDTICQHALLDTKPLIIGDMRRHPTFEAHPLVTDDPHWVFWAGFPLVTEEGYVLGTICAVDFEPRELSEEQVALLSGIAADMVLRIQMQTDRQEQTARDCERILKELERAGVTETGTARAFLNLCMEQPVTRDEHASLIALGLAQETEAGLELSEEGATLKTGNGLGPAEYKRAVSPLKNAELLDAMFALLD